MAINRSQFIVSLPIKVAFLIIDVLLRKGRDSSLYLLIVWLKVRVLPGSQTQNDRSTDEVGQFLSLVHFESREKVKELVTEGDKTTLNQVVSGSSLRVGTGTAQD